MEDLFQVTLSHMDEKSVLSIINHNSEVAIVNLLKKFSEYRLKKDPIVNLSGYGFNPGKFKNTPSPSYIHEPSKYFDYDRTIHFSTVNGILSFMNHVLLNSRNITVNQVEFDISSTLKVAFTEYTFYLIGLHDTIEFWQTCNELFNSLLPTLDSKKLISLIKVNPSITYSVFSNGEIKNQ